MQNMQNPLSPSLFLEYPAEEYPCSTMEDYKCSVAGTHGTEYGESTAGLEEASSFPC